VNNFKQEEPFSKRFSSAKLKAEVEGFEIG